jgi:hypothetical protein
MTATQPQGPLFSDGAIATVVRELDAAAERVIAQQAHDRTAGRCPTCGRAPRAFTAGHIYLAIGCIMFLVVTVIGTVGK